MKDKGKGIFNKCPICGKQLKVWSLYCKDCKKTNNNKYIVCDDKEVLTK